MKAVYKYPIPITDHFSLELPEAAQILCVQVQDGAPQLWALVEPTWPSEIRHFRLAGTGHPIEENGLRYIATFQLEGGALVFHVFER